MGQSHRIFLSAATNEYGTFRNELANALRGQYVEVEAVWSLLSQGNIEGAKAKLQECFELRPGLKSEVANAQVLECVALLALRTGHPENSLTYLAAAAKLREAAGNPRASLYAAELKKWEAEARQSLSDDDSAFAFKRGKDESPEKIIRSAEGMVKA